MVLTSGIKISVGTDDVVNKPVSVHNDILPGGNKATLTLADGSVIMLDSAASGKLTQQAGAVIEKSANGEIIYSFDKNSLDNNVVFNTMTTTRGGTYQLLLPDGSRVWLNAESSITFPTAFTANRREVKITGEVYFEIRPNKSKPFTVKTMTDEITVLGTSFNINAYNDEPVKTSLLQGKVKVNTIVLEPGRRFCKWEKVRTNLQQDLAWKNGRFDFSDLDATQAMNQVGRWYDVQIQYKGDVKAVQFSGSLKGSITLNDLLAGLEGMGGLHFTQKRKNSYRITIIENITYLLK